MSRGKLYLHIGNCKTGTTALQTFFERNRDTLAADGLYYPRTGTEYFSYNHWSLMYEYIADYSRVWPVPGAYRRHPGGFAGLFADLAQEIDRPLAAGQDVLLSCEGLFFDNRRRQDVTRLLEWFAPYDLQVVVYLRRQVDMLDSMVNELVKNGDIVYQQGGGEPFARELIIPYHRRLRWWADALGAERLTVRPYEKSRFRAGRDLFDEFMALVGHPRDDYQALPAEQNTAIRSMPGFLIMNSINRAAATAQQKFRFAALVQAWEQGRELPRYTVLDPALRDLIEAESTPDNAAIAADFLKPGERPLFNDPPAAPHPPPPADMKPSIEDLESFCRFLARHHPQACRRLAAMIAASPIDQAYGEYLGPLRILCAAPATIGATATTDGAAHSPPSTSAGELRRRLDRAEQDLADALDLLAQYHQALRVRTEAADHPPRPDFYRSRLYRYLARPIWAVTGRVRRIPGVRRAARLLRGGR